MLLRSKAPTECRSTELDSIVFEEDCEEEVKGTRLKGWETVGGGGEGSERVRERRATKDPATDRQWP